MTKKHRIILDIVIVIAIILIANFLPAIRSTVSDTLYSKLVENARAEALTANIKIVQMQYTESGNVSSVSVSVGASGVIFRKEGDRYYALTARHVVEKEPGVDKVRVTVMDYDDLSVSESYNKDGKFQSSSVYYLQFPEATIEYSNARYDLAVISFTSENNYAVLSIASDVPQFWDLVISIGNPYKQRNKISVGRISSFKPKLFRKDKNMVYPVIKHTAQVSPGSSGSCLLNEKFEIVGINIGGGENILRQNMYGVAMPSDNLRSFLDEWEGLSRD